MSKSVKSTLQMQFVENWMKTRPYRQASEYDIEYLKIANVALEIMEGFDYYFNSFGLNKADLVDLSTTIVAYYEDFINEAGFWKAFVTHNQERFGSYLPFYQLEDDYDPDYINPDDLSFLVWQWLMIRFEGRKLFSPVADPLLELGDELFDLLEEAIEDMPACDVYESLLTVADDDSFFKIRHFMEWLLQDNYLFGYLGFKQKFDAIIAESIEELGSDYDPKNHALITYDFKMGQLFRQRCMLGGLRACEWAARVLRCSPALKAQIMGIEPRMKGMFIYLSQDQDHYLFQHHDTQRQVPIAKESVDVDAQRGDLWYFSLIRWGNAYWSQGMSTSGYDKNAEKLPIANPVIPTLLMTPEERKSWLEVPQFHERKFIEVIGGPFKIFATGHEGLAAQAKVFQAITAEITGKPADEIPSSPFEEIDPNRPIAMYFVPGMGIAYCPHTPIIVEELLRSDKQKETSNALTSSLFQFVHPFVVDYILHHYPTDRLGWIGYEIDIIKEAKFLSTYYLPQEAGPAVPAVSFVASAQS